MNYMGGVARLLAGYFLVCLLSSFVIAPVAQAQTAGPGCNEVTTTAFAPVAGELVQLVSCTEELQQGGNQSLTIDVPTGVQAGDFLVYVLSTDGTNEDIDDPTEFSADWTLAGTYQPTPGITSEVFYRIADGTEPATYSWGWDSNEQYYSYMLRFTGASGLFSLGIATGTDATAETPAVTTNSINNLILKMVNIDQRDMASFNDTADVTGMTTPYYNVTEDSSRATGGGGGATTSAAALYYYQAAQGLSAGGTFDLSGAEEWHARTMGIEPIEFRFSMPDTTATVCGIQEVTVSVTDRLGNPMTWFDGTVTLSASNGLGAGWQDAGALNGILTDLGDGDATYQFSTLDAGTATFFFNNPNTGLSNFDLEFNGLANIENGAFDPDLTLTDCAPSVVSPNCVAGTSTTVTIGAQNIDPLLRGRMVLMAISFEQNNNVTSATFDPGGLNAPMTQIYEEVNLNGAVNTTELWGILDANLPVAAGTYTASFATTDPDPSMCLLYVTETNQAFPLPDLGTPSNGEVNGSQAQNQQVASTTITTVEDNSLVLSFVGNGSGGANDYGPPAPNPPMVALFDAPDPGGGAEFEGSAGVLASAGAITVSEDYGAAPNRHTHVVAAFRPLPPPVVTPTEIRLFHSTQSDVCSLEAVTISITDGSGNVDTSFAGTITVTTSALAGTWTVSSATNALVDNGGGSVDYTFDPADNGSIVLFYQLPTVNGAVDFDVTTTTPGISSPSGGFDPILDIASCTVEIQVTDGTAELCELGEDVTYTIRDRFGAVATDYAGILVLNNDTGNGNYSPIGENGTFDNAISGDGIATYVFDPADNGVLNLTFTNDTAETVNLTASSSGITLDGGSDVDVVFNECEFRIAYTDGDAGITDVCSVEQVQIGIYNSGGSLVTGYTGTINISTTTGNGTWIDPGGSALGTLTDPVAEDGSATYTFVGGDNGEIVLDFTDLTNEVVNINITDGTTSDPGDNMDPNDPDLTVDLCTLQISFDGGATFDDALSDACSVQQVTLTLVDRLGANPEVNYTGTVSLTTSTLNGNWSGGGGGTLIDTPGDDDGAATYQFAPGDGNTVTLDFINLHAEVVNIDAVDGVIIEDGLADPDVDIQSCLPAVADFSCVAGGSPLSSSVTIDAQDASPSLRGRMVLVATALEGNAVISGVTFDGAAMTLIRNERIEAGAFDNDTTLWGMLDTDLPAGAGSFNATVTHTDTDNASMCVFYVTDVEQVLPAPAVPDYSGQVNGSQEVSPNTTLASTTVTTTENNALVMSIVSNGSSGTYDNVSPHPPIDRLFSGPAPSSGAFAGSVGLSPTAAAITIDESPSVTTPNRHTHIVAAFNPLISGPPVAVDFEPVVLFETWSGNMSYRAIGNTFRTAANPTSCSFAATSSADLTLPDEIVPAGFDSTVTAAYLYWFASGDDALGHTDANVTFTDPSLTATNITADEIFLIDNIGSSNTNDYFAGYKDVTPLVTGNGTYTLSNLNIQNGVPWSNTQACAGGWALIVIYENPYEQLRVVNLFHGFQPFQNSNFTLVPRNFRMATPVDIEDLPNGQVTHVTVEGDETLSNGDESLQIQDAPGSTTFIPLVTYYNPPQAEFNGTITRPLYSLVDVDPGPGVTEYYLFDPSQGAGGYEIDFPGPDVGDEIPGPPDPDDTDEIGASWGVDIDTHYVSGDGNAGDGDDDVLNLFALAEAEEITTRYSSGQDLVLLVAEVISITNAPIADIEVFKNEATSFRIDQTGTYEYEVTNNGNGATSFGSATGEITLSDTLPAGMTFAAAGDVSGDGWVCSVTLDPGAFTCTFDIATDWTIGRGANVAGELGETSPGSGVGESLPTLTALVQIGDNTFFPNQFNDAKNVVRVVHSGGNCTAFPDGVSPNPSDCDQSPEFDDVNNLQSGTIDINTLDDKTSENNNVDSVTTSVVGVEVDLTVDKFVNGVLEEGGAPGAGQYTIRVTNLGADTTTTSFTITDNDPAFVTFVSVVPDPDWNCSTITPVLSCSYIGPGLAPAASKDLLLNVTVDGVEGDLVTNTVSVAPGPFNFDTDPGNDSDTDVTAIVAAPVGSTERFLISVSTALGLGGPTDLGGLDSFDDEDLVLYDPVLDSATLFFDHSDLGFSVDDINAVHLMPNGHIVLSANGPSIIGSNNLNFDEGDLVRYDPIIGDATLIFDGSSIFNDPGENIDAVYRLDNGNLVISTTGDAAIGGTSFDKSDLVEYDIIGGTASILVDGSDGDVFGSPDLTQVDAAYIRVDQTDATATIDTYALSTDDISANIGAGGTPVGGTNFTRDDITQLDRTLNESLNLFLGNVPLGVITDDGTGSPDPDMRLDGLHVIEDAYMGYFQITQSQEGNTCESGKITIAKLQGLTFDKDTDYFGAIRISTSTGTGTWGLDNGLGILSDPIPDDGEAIYIFVPGDNGDVTLSLAIDTVTTDLNVDVTNGFVEELGSEDPDFDFNNLVTVVTYRDEFSTAAFSNNDGSTGWMGDWFEIDDADGVNGGNSGAGVGAGNVRIGGGELSLTSNPSTDATGRDPSLARSADFGLYAATETIFLEFDYSYTALNLGDSIVVEVSDDAGSNWTAFPAYTGLSGAGGPIAESLNVSTLGGTVDDFTGSLSVRFRINNGYTLASTFYVDNVELRTGTTDCGIGVIDHYAIFHSGTGIQCLGSEITIVGHDANNFPAAPGNGEVMTLSTSTGKGTWASIISGAGSLVDIGPQGSPANTDGVATYTWFGNENEIVLRFNYTDLATDPELVNFELSGSYFEDEVTPGEDDDLSIRRAGLRFFNETDQVPGIPTQISGKPSNQYVTDKTIILQALQTSNDDATVCEPLFPDSQVVTIEFAAECDDPDNCSITVPAQEFTVNGTPITLDDQNGLLGADAYTAIPVTFSNQTTSTGAPLVLNYSDAGQVELHARYDIPFDSDPDFPVTSEDFLVGNDAFVVRPFGFDIDFSLDRAGGGTLSRADDASGPAFTRAGENFNTTVTARRWQAIDDGDFDGAPDADANLTDNPVTPNFGSESTALEDDVVITHVLVEPAVAIGSRDGTLTGGSAFSDFTAGTASEDLQFDEVGIITLTATLADNNYLGGGQDVQGNVVNVGRFYPHNFNLTGATTVPVYSSGNPFTYMGQEFMTAFMLEARNAADAITQNYIDDFVKLVAADFDDDSIFHAVEDNDLAADVDMSTRLTSVNGSFSAIWDGFGDAAPGTGSVMGDLIFARENDGMGVDGAEDGPFTLSIGTSAQDSDGVPITLDLVQPSVDIEVDDGITEPGTVIYRRIGANDIEFRYGRLLVDNAFGPETEALEIPLRVEYWNGSEFVTNADDSDTIINFVSADPLIDFVAGSYDADAGEPNPLGDGDVVIEQGSGDFDITLNGGSTGDTNIEADPNDPDRPFVVTAPAGEEVGRVLVELDLNNPSLGFKLDFLSYDWRDNIDADPYEELPDDIYTDNPRGIIEFGSYRGHDRVINWQEIYILD